MSATFRIRFGVQYDSRRGWRSISLLPGGDEYVGPWMESEADAEEHSRSVRDRLAATFPAGVVVPVRGEP